MEYLESESFDFLAEQFAMVRRRTAEIAREALKESGLEHPVIFVDGKKGASEDAVKEFGEIIYVADLGPLQQAIDLVELTLAHYASSAFKKPTGFYQSKFHWFVNGRDWGGAPPKANIVGARGNVQVVNLAGYASPVEIFVPNGIIYGAFNALRTMFGRRINSAYGYAPADAFDQVWPPDHTARPLAIPILTFGHPASTFEWKVRRPGTNLRRRQAHERAKARGRKNSQS